CEVAFLFIWVLARILACVHGHAKTPFDAPARSSSLATASKHVIRRVYAATSIRCALRFTRSNYVPGHRLGQEGMHAKSGGQEEAGTWSGSCLHAPPCTSMHLHAPP